VFFDVKEKTAPPLRTVFKKNKKGLASVILAPIRLLGIGIAYNTHIGYNCQAFYINLYNLFNIVI